MIESFYFQLPSGFADIEGFLVAGIQSITNSGNFPTLLALSLNDVCGGDIVKVHMFTPMQPNFEKGMLLKRT